MTFMGFNLPMFNPCNIGKKQSQWLNDVATISAFNQIAEIALSRFKWINLPPTCNERALEITLFFYGKAVLVNDPDIGYINTPVMLPGPFNLYYDSTVREAFSFNYRKKYDIENSALCRANYFMFPDYQYVWEIAPKIANALRAIDVMIETLKKPYIISCEEKEKNTVKRVLDSIADNDTAIVGRKFSTAGQIEVLNLSDSNNTNISQTWASVKNYYSTVFNRLGVKNSYTEKKERMITPEVQGESNSIRHSLESNLKCREQFCEDAKDIFGLDIRVEANELSRFTDEMLEELAVRVTGLQDTEPNRTELKATELNRTETEK